MARTPLPVLVVLLVAGCAAAGNPLPTAVRSPATRAPTAAVTAVSVPAATASLSEPSPTVAPPATVEPTPLPTAAACDPTPPDQLGPFYVPGAPERSSVGQGHILSGVVRSSVGCAPIPGARVELWMAGPDGEYRDDFRATLFADAAGAYRFESHVPVPYTGRPPHIHIRASADGYDTLVTQFYPAEGQTEGTFDLVLIPVN